MTKRQWAPLVGVEVFSGTAEDTPTKYRGFVTVRALAEDGSYMFGQLSPAELRRMAMHFMEVAEAAETDATVMTMLTGEVGLPPPTAASFVMSMRAYREEPDDFRKEDS